MGKRGPKRAQRVSGTGYTQAQARVLKYSRLADDGTYEIDTDTIRQIVDDYVNPENRIRKRIITNKKDNTVTEDQYYTPISVPGLRIALSIYNRETYTLWLNGFVNRDHMGDEGYIANISLSDALRAGEAEIARYLCEDADYRDGQKVIRQLETMGEIAPSKQVQDVSISGKVDLGRWSKWAR